MWLMLNTTHNSDCKMALYFGSGGIVKFFEGYNGSSAVTVLCKEDGHRTYVKESVDEIFKRLS